MFTKDGYHKALTSKTGDDAYILLGNGGHKKLEELLESASLGASGNDITFSITVAGTTKSNGITVPYANKAGQWYTARSLTIGSKSQSVDGTSNVTWTLDDIGVYSKGTTDSTFVKKAGDTMTGHLKFGGTANLGSVWDKGIIAGADGHTKVVLTYLASSTNGAVVGAHNSALSAWDILNVSGSQLIFRIAETEKMRLNASGYLGIGTQSPEYKLSVIVASDVWHAQFGTAAGKQLRIGGSTPYGSVIGAYNGNDNSSPATLMLQRDGGKVVIGHNSAGEQTLDVNGVQQIYIRGNNNTAFRDLLLLKQQNSSETSGQTWDPAYPSFGIGFRRYWTSGSSPYGETTCAGIYSTVSSSWKGGLVFRTKNNETQGGTHDTTSLRLRPDGVAEFPNEHAIRIYSGSYNYHPIINDSAGRPGISISGNYPYIWLMGGGTTNALHGATITLAAPDSAAGTNGAFKAWTFGVPGQGATWMDLAYGVNNTNPHAYIDNWSSGTGLRLLRFNSNPAQVVIWGVGNDTNGSLIVNSSRASTWVYGGTFLGPNLGKGHNIWVNIGKANSTRNSFGLSWHHDGGDGSTGNYGAIEIFGVGNQQRWYCDGNTCMYARFQVRNTGNGTYNYDTSSMWIREYNYGGSQADTWGNAPRLGWHWSGRVAAQIGLASNGWLYEAPSTGTSFYKIVCETGTWGINITGNAGYASSAGNADTVDGYHYNNLPYLPISGGTMTGTPYINMPASAASISNNQPFGITYGRIQAYGDLFINGDTDGSTTEYVHITAGYGAGTSGVNYGLGVGYNNLYWKGGVLFANTSNVGIGTTSPAYKLDVNGNTYIRGSLTTDAALATRSGDFCIWTKQNYAFLPKCIFVIENIEWARLEMDTSAAFHFKHSGSNDQTYSRIYAASFNQGSDIRKKNIIKNVNINIYDIANAPLFKFTWKDESKYSGLHIGSSAQYWQTMLPELVNVVTDGEQILTMQYDVIALAAAITVAKKTVENEQKISYLENQITQLRNEILNLKNTDSN